MPIIEKVRAKSPVLFTREREYVEPVIEGNKALRAEDLYNSLVTIDNIIFNADERAMDRMDRVVDIANWKFNQAVANGATAGNAYNAVYLANTLSWKSADDVMVTVTVEQICRAQEAAIHKMSEVWAFYG